MALWGRSKMAALSCAVSASQAPAASLSHQNIIGELKPFSESAKQARQRSRRPWGGRGQRGMLSAANKRASTAKEGQESYKITPLRQMSCDRAQQLRPVLESVVVGNNDTDAHSASRCAVGCLCNMLDHRWTQYIDHSIQFRIARLAKLSFPTLNDSCSTYSTCSNAQQISKGTPHAKHDSA